MSYPFERRSMTPAEIVAAMIREPGAINFHGISTREANAALRALLAEREAMRGALEFYARPYTWRSSTVYMCGHSGPTHADFDAGKKARDALSALTPPAPAPKEGESEICEGCPPQSYPTDETRCLPCPRRTEPVSPPTSPDQEQGR